jgi:hypothetical protein
MLPLSLLRPVVRLYWPGRDDRPHNRQNKLKNRSHPNYQDRLSKITAKIFNTPKFASGRSRPYRTPLILYVKNPIFRSLKNTQQDFP